MLLAKMDDPAQVAKFIRDTHKGPPLKRTLQVWKSSLMTVSSLGGAVASDMASVASDLYSTAVTAAGQAFSKDPGRVRFAEVPAKISGMLHSTARALTEARAMYGSGKGVAGGQPEMHGPMNALDRYGPMAGLRAETEFFYRWAYDGEVAALATRQGLQKGLKGKALEEYRARAQEKPESFMMDGKSFDKLADTAAKHRTFQDRSPVAEAWTRFGEGKDRFGRPIENSAPMMDAARLASRFLMPFPRIAANLSKAALEHSPIAHLVLPEVRTALKAGGTEAALARGRMNAGTSAMAMVAYMVSKGLITGNGPVDPDERRAWLAAGNKENSLKVGDKRIELSLLGPVGAVAGLAANFAEILPKMSDGTIDNLGARVTMAFVKNLPAMRDYAKLGDLVHAATDWKDNGGKRALQRLVATAVPNQISKANQLFDPYLHDTQTQMDEFRARIPGMSQGLAKRIDAWGTPIKNDSPGLSLFFPVRASSVTDDPVRQAAVALKVKLDAPDRSLQIGKKPKLGTAKMLALNPQQYEQLSRLVGAEAHGEVEKMMATPLWARLKDEQKREALKLAYSNGRKRGTSMFRRTLGVPEEE
jgi:hypothetical protein